MNRTARLFTDRRLVPLFALFVNFVWGTGYSLTKILYAHLRIGSGDLAKQIWLMGMRAITTGLVLLAVMAVKDRRLPSIKKIPVRTMVGLCLSQVILQYFFMYVGLAHASGTHAAIIDPTAVFSSVLIAGLIFKTERLTAGKLIGTLVGFLGVVLVNLEGITGGEPVTFLGEGFLVIAMVVYAFSESLIKVSSRETSPVTLYGAAFLIGGVVLLAAGLIMGGAVTEITPAAAGLFLYLSAAVSASFLVFGLLLKYNPVSSVTVYGFTIPIFGVLMGIFALKETNSFNARTLISLALVTLGIVIVNRSQTEEADLPA